MPYRPLHGGSGGSYYRHGWCPAGESNPAPGLSEGPGVDPYRGAPTHSTLEKSPGSAAGKRRRVPSRTVAHALIKRPDVSPAPGIAPGHRTNRPERRGCHESWTTARFAYCTASLCSHVVQRKCAPVGSSAVRQRAGQVIGTGRAGSLRAVNR
jgi:hypothetical protein